MDELKKTNEQIYQKQTKSVQRFKNFVFSKKGIIAISIPFLFILFHIPIELFLSNTVVEFLLSSIEKKWYNDIIFLFITIAIVIWFIKKFKNYIPSLSFIFYLAAAAIIYLFYRTSNNPWEFTSFQLLPNLKYADVIFIAAIGNLFLLIKPKRNENENNENSFFYDMPLNGQEDKLGYNIYAKNIAAKIESSFPKEAFAIGINGKWGIGKSSFINLIKDNITDSEIIEIDFKPWYSETSNAIIKDFFETFNDKIGQYHSSISRLLVTYSEKLISLNSNTINESIQTAIATVSGFETLSSLKQEIVDSIKMIDKKIVIYIDDIDRLDKNEILEVIKLIRNSANFLNTFFVVAYDKNYIVNALKSHNPYNQEQFLEKIFQLEISLPYFDKDILKKELAEKLKIIFPQKKDLIDEKILKLDYGETDILEVWLDNLRDVTRLANSLSLNLKSLIGKFNIDEVDFKDFIYLELLRLKYPSVYEILFKRASEFLEVKKTENEIGCYKLRSIPHEKITHIPASQFIQPKYVIEYFLQKNHENLCLPTDDIEKIISLLKLIFLTDIVKNTFPKSHLSVVYPKKFIRYFSYYLPAGTISQVEFNEARKSTQEIFNRKISEWVSKKLEYEVIDQFRLIKQFENKDDFEKVVTGIFYFANQKTMFPEYNPFTNFLIGFPEEHLSKILNNSNGRLVKKYYSEDGGNQSLRKFLIEKFDNAVSPYFFESDFIKYINDEAYSDEERSTFPISIEEINKIVIGYLKKICKDSSNFDHRVMRVYANCKQKKLSPRENFSGQFNENNYVSPEVKKIVADFIFEKSLDDFLFWSISSHGDESHYIIFKDYIFEFFENFKKFEVLLNNASEEKWVYLNEFKRFFNLCKEKDFSDFVKFQFINIPIKEKNYSSIK